MVQIVGEDGSITEYTTQQEVQTAIWDNIHQDRYHLVEEVPIAKVVFVKSSDT